MELNSRDKVTQDWVNKNKESEKRQAKLRAKDKIADLQPNEKEVLAVLASLEKKHTPKLVSEMMTLLRTVQAE